MFVVAIFKVPGEILQAGQGSTQPLGKFLARPSRIPASGPPGDQQLIPFDSGWRLVNG